MREVGVGGSIEVIRGKAGVTVTVGLAVRLEVPDLGGLGRRRRKRGRRLVGVGRVFV